MKTFRSTKLRKAAVVVSCEVSQKFVVIEVPPEDGKGEPLNKRVRVADNFFGRGVPVAGDYFLLYPTGYASWCPKAEFEDGHAEADNADAPDTQELEDTVAVLSKENAAQAIKITELESKLAEADKAKEALAKEVETLKTPDADSKE